jgi:hypothetical protein
MRKPGSMNALEDFGRVRLSPNFFMRDCLTRPGMANHEGSHAEWYRGFTA